MDKKFERPGGKLDNRPLHFFWVVDCSGSMAGEKIGAVNHAIQEAIQPMREAAENNPNAQLYVRTLKFATGASWLTAEPVPIEEFSWQDLTIDDFAVTDLGKALEMISAQLEMPPMPERSLPPVVVLLSDGRPTDDWKRPLDKLLSMPWGKKAVKIAIGIGKDADEKILQQFTTNEETVLKAGNPDALVHLIKWASTIASTVSAPTTKPDPEEALPEPDSGVHQESKPQGAPVSLPNNITLPDLSDIDIADVW